MRAQAPSGFMRVICSEGKALTHNLNLGKNTHAFLSEREQSMFKSDLLSDRIACITGGGSGLGLSMAKRFAELGAKIVILGRNADRLAQGAQAITEAGQGREAVTFVCDVRDYEAVAKTVNEVEQRVGLPHILVNNAAGNFLAASEDLSPGGFDAVVKIVLYGTFNCTHALANKWIAAQRPGTILNIVATYADNGSAFVAFGLRQSRRPGHDALACRRMGNL